jgi:hypothetical protein
MILAAGRMAPPSDRSSPSDYEAEVLLTLSAPQTPHTVPINLTGGTGSRNTRRRCADARHLQRVPAQRSAGRSSRHRANRHQVHGGAIPGSRCVAHGGDVGSDWLHSEAVSTRRVGRTRAPVRSSSCARMSQGARGYAVIGLAGLRPRHPRWKNPRATAVTTAPPSVGALPRHPCHRSRQAAAGGRAWRLKSRRVAITSLAGTLTTRPAPKAAPSIDTYASTIVAHGEAYPPETTPLGAAVWARRWRGEQPVHGGASPVLVGEWVLVAQGVVELVRDCSAYRGRHDPWAIGPRWLMAKMLLMPTRQDRHPVPRVVRAQPAVPCLLSCDAARQLSSGHGRPRLCGLLELIRIDKLLEARGALGSEAEGRPPPQRLGCWHPDATRV